jgi:predicted SprT family Zn-dependent metalloprotease
MNRTDAFKLAADLMAQYRLLNWTFRFNRAMRTAGLCKYREQCIELSGPFTDLNTVEHVRDTLLHEIAHALVGPGHRHNFVWQCMARNLGANPAPCCAADAAVPLMRYQATCGQCGYTFSRSRPLRQGRRAWCGRCGRSKGRSDACALVFTDSRAQNREGE